MKRISVIICTHNRLRYLDGLFGSLMRQTLPREEFEIIFVDNASTDGTREWAPRAKSHANNRGLNFTYIHEPTVGLSRARNAGWQAANSEIIAFLDDDAVAQSHWLERILERFSSRDERLAVVGGKVEPLWEAPPPDWLVPELWPFLSVLDWSPTEMILGEQQYFVGANMAIRNSALRRIGGFSTKLGRRGGRLLSNEEIHLKRRLEQAGFYALYAPDVAVQHSVPRERMSREWFRRRYYWQGISDVFMEEAMQAAKGGLTPWAIASLSNARASWRVVQSRIRFAFAGNSPPEPIFLQELKWYHQAGYVAGRWQLLLGLRD